MEGLGYGRDADLYDLPGKLLYHWALPALSPSNDEIPHCHNRLPFVEGCDLGGVVGRKISLCLGIMALVLLYLFWRAWLGCRPQWWPGVWCDKSDCWRLWLVLTMISHHVFIFLPVRSPYSSEDQGKHATVIRHGDVGDGPFQLVYCLLHPKHTPE